MVKALVAHVAAEDATVGGEARDGDAEVVVDLEDLALEGRQLGWGALEGSQDGVCVTLLLNGWWWWCAAVVASKRTRNPTAALPCLTASIAYSIWWIRPCGLHVTTSVSYCGNG